MIAILSVENTGTHFTQQVVRRLTGKKLGWAPAHGPEGLIQHVYPVGFDVNADFLIDSVLGVHKVVVPMRDPIKALISNHDRGHRRLPFRDHALSFARIARWTDVHFFPIESPNMSDLASYLGVRARDIRVPPQNVTPSRKHSPLRTWYANGAWKALDDALLGAVSLLREQQDFFNRFGYEVPC